MEMTATNLYDVYDILKADQTKKICICSHAVQNQILSSCFSAFTTTIFHLFMSLKAGIPLQGKRIFENNRPRKKFGPKLDTAIRELKIIGKRDRESGVNHGGLYGKICCFCKLSAKQSAG